MKRNMPWVSATFVPGNSTGYCQPLDVGVFRSFKSRLLTLCTQEIAQQSIDGDFDITDLNQRGFKRQAIGGWVAS
eukprot:2193480-Amphidinium_carterae.1